MKLMRHFFALAAALVTTTGAAVANACPVCAQRTDGGIMGNVALGAMVLSPWIVGLSVGLWIRRSTQDAAPWMECSAGAAADSETTES